MNVTLLALSASIIFKSPMMIQPSYSMKSKLNFQQLNINQFCTNFIYSQSISHDLSITRSSFTNFIQQPIKIEANTLFNGKYDTNQTYHDSSLSVFSCEFINCTISYDGEDVDHNFVRGGAIFYEHIEGSVTIYSSIFDNCKVINGDGGALFICGEVNMSGYNMLHESIKHFNSSYCCYSDCYATTRQSYAEDNAPNSGYGPIMLTFSEETELFYSSSVNSEGNDITSYGAQFDLTASTIKSSYINSTNGKSVYCSGIEYRNTKDGYFTFQTIVGQTGRTVCSFRDLSTNVDISFCNLVNDTVNNKGGIFNIDESTITISNFCFLNIAFIDDSNFLTGINYKVNVINCSIDRTNEEKLHDIHTENIVFYETDDKTKSTNDIKLLNLGSCGGVLTPPPEPTLTFSVSSQFSPSNQFSKTGHFSESGKFTKSNVFIPSEKFTGSNFFTNSKIANFDPGAESNAGSGLGKGAIAGIAIAAVVAAAGIIALIMFLVKYKLNKNMFSENADINETNDSSINTANPIYGEGEDDPFQADFHDADTAL